MTSTTGTTERSITHVETVYRPGERELAKQVFELLGFRVLDRGGTFFTAMVEPEQTNGSVNACYSSEVTAEQWALESELQRQAGDAVERFRTGRRTVPQRSFHFGFRVGEQGQQDALVERVRAAGEAGDLAGRVGVDGVFRPGDPGALAPNMVQAFVWTDVIASGLLTLGQYVEIQWHLGG